jgi:hypothetical protein
MKDMRTLLTLLFLTFAFALSSQVVFVEPTGTRKHDEVFVKLYSDENGMFTSNDFRLSFSPRGALFSTMKFVFPPIPAGFFTVKCPF